MDSIAVVGGTYIDHLVQGHVDSRDPSGNVVASAYSEQFGGCAFNTAVVAARMGAQVTLFTWMSDDDRGRAAKQYAEEAGVTVRVVREIPSLPRIIVLINRDTCQRRFISFESYWELEHAKDLLNHVADLREHTVVHFAGLGPNTKFAGTDLGSVLNSVTKTSLDADPSGSAKAGPMITGDIVKVNGFTASNWEERLGMAINFFTAFFPNDEEILQFTDDRDARTAAETLIGRYQRLKLIGVKVSSRGCWITQRLSDTLAMQAMPEDFGVKSLLRGSDSIRDQTGAGDAWCGAFLATWLRTKNVVAAAQQANAVASECVMHLGATDGLTVERIQQTIELAPHLAIVNSEDFWHEGSGLKLA